MSPPAAQCLFRQKESVVGGGDPAAPVVPENREIIPWWTWLTPDAGTASTLSAFFAETANQISPAAAISVRTRRVISGKLPMMQVMPRFASVRTAASSLTV